MPKTNRIKASRYHDISVGHRVVGHEGKCRHLHGHNYRIHFHCESKELDSVGRVIDFGQIKSLLCMWLEEEWDHKFLVWNDDPVVEAIIAAVTELEFNDTIGILNQSFVEVPFNPTAENMAKYLVEYIGPRQLEGTGIVLTSVVIEETRKCSVTYEL